MTTPPPTLLDPTKLLRAVADVFFAFARCYLLEYTLHQPHGG